MLRKAGGSNSVLGVIKARDDYWRRSRQVLNPTFSAHKMKLVRLTDARHDKLEDRSVSEACLVSYL